MKIGFIGAGKVGFSLGKYFAKHNIYVTGYYSKNVNSSKEAALFTVTSYFSEIEELVKQSDIIFITTSDGAIQEVWNSIKEMSIKDKIVCHCSGSLSSDIFSNREYHNVYGYSVHPIYAFSDKYNSHLNLKEATITIEGDKKHLSTIKGLFEQLGNKVKIISRENKAIYHAASVFVSNHIISLVQTSVELLNKCGFSEQEAIDSLFPLILNNINNIGTKGVVNSLTGPVERCDIGTVAKHLNSLDDEEKEIYRLLSKKLIKIAKKKNQHIDYSSLEKMIGE